MLQLLRPACSIETIWDVDRPSAVADWRRRVNQVRFVRRAKVRYWLLVHTQPICHIDEHAPAHVSCLTVRAYVATCQPEFRIEADCSLDVVFSSRPP